MADAANVTVTSTPLNLFTAPAGSQAFRYAPMEFLSTLPGLALILLMVLIFASIMGTAGNVLILVAVATNKELQKVESVFVVNLACCDLYVTLIADPLSIVAKTLGWELFDSVPGLCRAVGSICTVSCIGSLMTLSAMSCNRYVHIVHPSHYSEIFTLRHSILMCCSFYALGFFFVFLNFFGIGDHSFDHKSLECFWDRMANHSYTVVFAVVMVWVPVIVTGAAYGRLYMHVRQVRMKVHNRENSRADESVVSRNHRGVSIIEEGNSDVNNLGKSVQKNDLFEENSHISEENAEIAADSNLAGPSSANIPQAPTVQRAVNTMATAHMSFLHVIANPADKHAKSGRRTNKIGGRTVKTERTNIKSTLANPTLKLARGLFLIYLVFSICWLPFSFLMILDAEDTFAHELHVVIVVWAHLHPSVNWLVYYHTHTKFRKAFRHLIGLDGET